MKPGIRSLAGITAVAVACMGVRHWNSGAIPVSVTINGELSYEAAIAAWQVIGPFQFTESAWREASAVSDVGLNHDYLAEYGEPEGTVREAALKQLTGAVGEEAVRSTRVLTGGPTLDFRALFATDSYAVAYAASIIQSTLAQDVGLVIGSDDACKVWLNGRLVLAESLKAEQGLRKYHHVERVRLSKGRNLLLAKVDQKRPGKWGLAISVVSAREAERLAVAHHAAEWMFRRILKPGDRPLLNVRVFGPRVGSSVAVNITGPDGVRRSVDVPTSGDTVALPPTTTDGYYSWTATVSDLDISGSYFTGDLTAFVKDAESLIPRLSADDAINAQATIHRLRHLLHPSRAQGHDAVWNRKVMQLVGEVVTTQQLGRPYRGRVGRHLRGYRSRVDGSVQHYQVFVPHTAPKALPVAFIVPPDQGTLRPFLESNWVALEHEILELERAATATGIAVVWPGWRGNVSDSTLAYADFLEIVEDLKRNYTLDEGRLYAAGYCAGGRRALLLAERYPHVLAAVAGIATALPGTRESEGDVFEHARNLRNVRVYLLHGALDPEGPVDKVLAFRQECQRFGSAVVVDVIPEADNQYFPDDRDLRVFRFFERQKREKPPTGVSLVVRDRQFATAHWLTIRRVERAGERATADAALTQDALEVDTSNVARLGLDLSAFPSLRGTRIRVRNGRVTCDVVRNGLREVCINRYAPPPTYGSRSKDVASGPIGAVFGGRVIVVRTRDAPSSAFAKAVLEQWTMMWRQQFFVEARVIDEEQLTEREMRRANLVVVGSPRVGTALAQLVSAVPVKHRGGGLEIAGTPVDGPASYVVLYPHALSRGCYIMLIGSSPGAVLDDARVIATVVSSRADVLVWPATGARWAAMFDEDWSTLRRMPAAW